MASANPPVKGAAFAFETALIAQADTDIFKTGPTLVAGDVRVVQDGVLLGNITTLPTAVTNCTNLITVSLSAAEMNADRIAVLFHDAAGDEWQDQEIMIFTSAQTFDTSDGIVDDIKATVNSATYGNSALATAIGDVATAISGVTATVAISAAQAEQIAEGMIALAAYADFAQSITATTADNLATAKAFWFCVKARATDADADAVLLLSAADGLVTLAGATYATPANGTLTVFGTAGAWTVAATLTAQATALLTDYAGRHLVAEIKYRLASDAVRVLWSGVAAISRSVIHRTA